MQETRRERGLARLELLGDEPGGEAFSSGGQPMGDWLVDWTFGEVHTRPGLAPRERELIIVAVLTASAAAIPGGGPHPGAARDRRALRRSRRRSCRQRPMRRPTRDQRAESAEDGARSMKAVRFVDAARRDRLGRLDGDRSSTPAGGDARLRARRRGLGRSRRGRRPAFAVGDVTLLHPGAGQDRRHRPQLPRPRRGVRAGHPRRAGRVRQVARRR